MSDADRFILLFSVAAVERYSIDDLIKLFAKALDWNESRARSAFEVCVVKGWIDNQE